MRIYPLLGTSGHVSALYRLDLCPHGNTLFLKCLTFTLLSLYFLLACREVADGGRLAVEVEDKSVKIRNVKVRVFFL